MGSGNIFASLPEDLQDEVFDDLVRSDHVMIQRIVSWGHHSPQDFWYDQATSEWVMVIKGRAQLLLEGDSLPITLAAGDYINIPAGVRHRVHWTDPHQQTVWLAVHYRF